MATEIVTGFERFFDGMGLMTGEAAIPKRMMVGALAGAFLVTYFKPSLMFEAGRARPWGLTAPSNSELDPTMFPWWFVPIIGAFVGGVLI